MRILLITLLLSISATAMAQTDPSASNGNTDQTGSDAVPANTTTPIADPPRLNETSVPAPANANKSAPDDNTAPVVVSGTVPDEATRAAILQKLHQTYGSGRVVDHIQVGGVVAPANWSRYISRMIGPDIKHIHHGQVKIQGNIIDIRGEVPNEVVKQQILSNISSDFDANYGIKQRLRIAISKQKVLNDTLANRTVQFESGSANLTPAGKTVLDDMARAIKKLDDPFINIVGNTDDVGKRMTNIELSLDRASAVKDYLVAEGIPANKLSVSGMGPDNPVASNDTEAGRALNRRIDFRILKQ